MWPLKRTGEKEVCGVEEGTEQQLARRKVCGSGLLPAIAGEERAMAVVVRSTAPCVQAGGAASPRDGRHARAMGRTKETHLVDSGHGRN